MTNFTVYNEKVENIEQDENEDTCTINLSNGNEWKVQRIDGVFNQQLGCQLTKNGENQPDWDDESEFVVKYANLIEEVT
jgi:hypothetical protein